VFPKPSTEAFLTSCVVLYCVKSLHKRSLVKLFTQAHWSNSQSHAIMDFWNLWKRKDCYRFTPASFHTAVWNNASYRNQQLLPRCTTCQRCL